MIYLAFILTAYPSCSILHLHWTSAGHHDWLTGKPSRSHFTSPVYHPLFAHMFAQPSEYYHCNWAREFQVSQEWLYIHNSVLPHSSQYIGDYITIRWILTIETDNINFVSNTNETDTQISHQRLCLVCGAVLRAHTTLLMLNMESITSDMNIGGKTRSAPGSWAVCVTYVTERATFKAFQIVS